MLEHICEAVGGDASRLWLAGDPAQAITSGVSFRFADVRSALHLRNAAVPGKPMRLSRNYRSHSGILDVARKCLEALEALEAEVAMLEAKMTSEETTVSEILERYPGMEAEIDQEIAQFNFKKDT